MKNVLILAAGNISNKLSFIKAYYASPALIPINTKPLILYHLEFYSKCHCKIYLVINSRDEQYIEESVNLKEYDFEIIGVPDSHGVNESLAYAFRKIVPAEETIVNLVTSIPLEFPKANTVYLQQELTYNNDWSGIKISGPELRFLPKKEEQKLLSHAFTGIFNIDGDVLGRIIKNVRNKSDLLEIIQRWHAAKTEFNYELGDWIDTGHELNYYQSKLVLISSRSFNAVSVNDSGVLTKSSSNFSKLKDEANFITAIPSDLAIYFPRIIEGFNYDSEQKRGKYSMEFYGYPSLAELQLYWDLKEEIWQRIFTDLKKVIQKFKHEPYSIGHLAFNNFYTGKIAQRVNDFYEMLPPGYKYLIKDNLIINGVACKSYYELKNQLFERINNLYNEDDFCITHGDFCFNNILYDIAHRLIKVIDPRGSFGENCKGLYGDVKYDLAKLLHSAIGGYDYLVNNLYKLELHGEEVNYRILFKSNFPVIKKAAKETIAELGYEYRDIMLIVGTLFISMTPLHADSSNRQKVMFIHGLKIINENI
jgi:choline kinase